MKTTRGAFPILFAAFLAVWIAPEAGAASSAPQVVDTLFSHDTHSELTCLDCHRMDEEHGTTLVRSAADCRSCHHVRERTPRDCAACHERDDLRNVVRPLQRALSLSVYATPSPREVRFDHGDHLERECAECHASGPDFSVPGLQCASCHEEHHDPTASGCRSCHVEPAMDAHPPEVHLTCSGSGCHSDPPFPTPVRTRVGCLWCHEEQVDHEPRQTCVECHFVSGARDGAALRPPQGDFDHPQGDFSHPPR